MTAPTTVKAFFDAKTWTVTYVVSDPATRRAAVIDAVLDYDFKSGHTGTHSADAVLAYLAEQQLQVDCRMAASSTNCSAMATPS